MNIFHILKTVSKIFPFGYRNKTSISALKSYPQQQFLGFFKIPTHLVLSSGIIFICEISPYQINSK